MLLYNYFFKKNHSIESNLELNDWISIEYTNLHNLHNLHNLQNKHNIENIENKNKTYLNSIESFSNDFVNTLINSSIKSISIKNFSNDFVNTVINLTILKVIDYQTTIIKINEMINNPTNYFIKYILIRGRPDLDSIPS
jgi:hypothetical protein